MFKFSDIFRNNSKTSHANVELLVSLSGAFRLIRVEAENDDDGVVGGESLISEFMLIFSHYFRFPLFISFRVIKIFSMPLALVRSNPST